MKKIAAYLVAGVVCSVLLGACAAHQENNLSERTAKKIYLTKEDYMEDLGKAAEVERREAQPNVESEYIFNAVPETETTVYFFDKRQQPKVPGEYSAQDYKNEKRLWNKPKRFSPEEYYGMQEGTSNAGGGGETSYYQESSYEY